MDEIFSLHRQSFMFSLSSISDDESTAGSSWRSIPAATLAGAKSYGPIAIHIGRERYKEPLNGIALSLNHTFNYSHL